MLNKIFLIILTILNRIFLFGGRIFQSTIRIIGYSIAKRSQGGKASMSINDILHNSPTYIGSTRLDGKGGRNLLAFGIFRYDPFVRLTPWFKKIQKQFIHDTSGFNYPFRYYDWYPYLKHDVYKMNTAIPEDQPINFNSMDELLQYAPIGKLTGKEAGVVVEIGNNQYMTTGDNKVMPIDDVGGHIVLLYYDKEGYLIHLSQDLAQKFDPIDYTRHSKSEIGKKQAALMDKISSPFILTARHYITINNKFVKHG